MVTEKLVIKLASDLSGFGVDKITPESTPYSLGMDSLDTLELLVCIDDEFGVEIDEAQVSEGTTLQDISEMIKAL